MPAPKKYPDELRERAVEMVFRLRAERGSSYGVVRAVAREVGVGDQSLRQWVKQADAERSGLARGGDPDRATSSRRIAELERENEQLRRSNSILRAAMVFFSRELDPRPPLS